MSQHTPEPWYIFPNPWPPSIRTSERGYEIARVQSPYTNSKYRDEERANGNRIVACINACAGIADPKAAIDAAREALTGIARQYKPCTACDGVGSHTPDCKLALALKLLTPIADTQPKGDDR